MRRITYNLVWVVPERLDCGILVVAVEGNGKLLARRTEDTVVNDIVTSRWARHCSR